MTYGPDVRAPGHVDSSVMDPSVVDPSVVDPSVVDLPVVDLPSVLAELDRLEVVALTLDSRLEASLAGSDQDDGIDGIDMRYEPA